MSGVIPMTSARVAPGRYEVLGTSTGCEVRRIDTGTNWPVWILYSDDKYVEVFSTKREALIYCQEHPEL